MSYERKTEEMIEITFFRKELNQKIAFLHKNQTIAEKLGMFNIFLNWNFFSQLCKKNKPKQGWELCFGIWFGNIRQRDPNISQSYCPVRNILVLRVSLFLAHQRYPGNANNVTFSLPFTVRSSSKLSNITKRTNINNLETAGNSESRRLRTHWITWLVT